MKGYKAFNPDWTCRGKQYAVGEIATQGGKLVMCENGIHFCKELADCFRYYNMNPENKLAEVEVLGRVLRSNNDYNDSKCCTDKLKVIRELSIAEL